MMFYGGGEGKGIIFDVGFLGGTVARLLHASTTLILGGFRVP